MDLIITIIRRTIILLMAILTIIGIFHGHPGIAAYRLTLNLIPIIENATFFAVTFIEVLI